MRYLLRSILVWPRRTIKAGNVNLSYVAGTIQPVSCSDEQPALEFEVHSAYSPFRSTANQTYSAELSWFNSSLV